MMSSLKYVLLITSLAYVRIATGIQIVYAAKVNRFIYYDYYFTCSSEGSAQIWRVNQESLGSFTISNRAGSLLKSSRDNFTYIATLASLTPRMQDKYEFRSVMIVTTQRELNLEATCLTESMEDSVNNGNASFSSLRTMKNSVSAEHIALAAMDSNETVISNILLCGVNGSFLDWQVGGRNYRFDSNSQVGATFHIIKNGTFEEQAILIAKEPYQFVSVLFITVPIDFEVYCISSEGNFQFFVTNESITTTFSFPTIAMSSYRINGKYLFYQLAIPTELPIGNV